MNIFNLICHRKPERSFFINDYQFPVCARCTGFYITLVLYFVYILLLCRLLSIFNSFGYCFLIPAVIDGTTQLFSFRESNNTLRFLTGLLGGLGLGILIKALKYFIFLKFRGI